MKDVGLAQAVLQRRSGNDRIVHRSKVTCDALFGRGVWSRGGTGGCRRFDCPVSVRMPQMPWLTSASSGALMSVRLPGWRMPPHQRRPVASAGWCHDRRLFRGRYGIYRQPRRGDLGASVLVRAGCGEGECGGARLVGSEKSPIVTRRWCVGLGCAALTRPEPSVTLSQPGRLVRQVARAVLTWQTCVTGHCRPREWTATHQG